MDEKKRSRNIGEEEKTKKMLYLSRRIVGLLEAYGYQTGKKHSWIVEELIEKYIEPQVDRRFLK